MLQNNFFVEDANFCYLVMIKDSQNRPPKSNIVYELEKIFSLICKIYINQ